MPRTPPPLKTPFSQRREREFLFLPEIDALITALQRTRSPIRNQVIAVLLFCQALQPVELCWLQWRDLNIAENLLRVTRTSNTPTRYSPHVEVNFQPLCAMEINCLQHLEQQRTTDWLFTSERRTRLCERSVHHLIQQAGKSAGISLPIHPYMLRRSGLFYRSALLLQPLNLSLRQCCLLWNWNGTTVKFTNQEEQEYQVIDKIQEAAFLAALKQLQVFTQIQLYENVVDYLLGAYSLFPRLQGIPTDYWLAPVDWVN